MAELDQHLPSNKAHSQALPNTHWNQRFTRRDRRAEALPDNSAIGVAVSIQVAASSGK
jgi:hypothetical protein